MINRGVLFQGAFVSCFSETGEDADFFVSAFDKSLEIYGRALDEGYEKYLSGPPVKPVFRKYN